MSDHRFIGDNCTECGVPRMLSGGYMTDGICPGKRVQQAPSTAMSDNITALLEQADTLERWNTSGLPPVQRHDAAVELAQQLASALRRVSEERDEAEVGTGAGTTG